MGLSLMGVEQLNSVPQYSDALTSIDQVIQRAKDNLQAITDNFTYEDNGVELPIPEADSANEETQMNDPGTPGKVELPDINQGSNL